jgi:tRNA-(ms[2]io[6]A)-hydroxylase
LEQVLRHLKKRGGELERLHKSPYVNDLRALVRAGKGKQEILDRMLVSALIEARSCERFHLLAKGCRDEGLAAFYQGLEASESGHYAVFLDLARTVLPQQEVEARWVVMRDREAEIIQRQAPGPRIHSGMRG